MSPQAHPKTGFPSFAHLRHRSVDAASLEIFRILFGALLFVGLVRFWAQGWIEALYVEPTFFFKYDLAPWAFVPSPFGLHALFAFSAASALLVCVGLFYRVAIVCFALSFTYIQLMDVTNYLNHYVLVCLLAWTMVFVPLGRVYSVDAWRKRRGALPQRLPRVWLWYFRFQFAVVYINAALAKATSDWLIHAQPMGIWMKARTETPLIGPLLDESWFIYLLSTSGFLYDLTIVFFLLHKKTRPFAYAVVLGFHGMTSVFFDIGLFPFIMTFGTTLFFDPSWPRRFFASAQRAMPRLEEVPSAALSKITMGILVVVVCAQVLIPLRHYAIPGDVLWTEEGMRYSWKVMVREKNGALTYTVRERSGKKEWQVSPTDYLTWRQANEMSSQPDLIVQLAKHIAWDFQKRGFDVSVNAESWVSLNGRKRALMFDPKVDLVRASQNAPAPYLLPKPKRAPLSVR